MKNKIKISIKKNKSLKHNKAILDELKQRFKNLYLEEEQDLALISWVLK